MSSRLMDLHPFQSFLENIDTIMIYAFKIFIIYLMRKIKPHEVVMKEVVILVVVTFCKR
jgi:hypothetical protein